MKYTRNYFFWFVVASICIILTACHKDPSKVGFDIQPDSDRIDLYGYDTLVFFLSYTVEDDSVATSISNTLVLGSIDDPVFGTTQAAFNTQFRLSKTNPNFGKGVKFDSICLQLGYSGQWGDSTTMMTAHVYRLTDSLYYNSDTTGGKELHEGYYATDVAKYDPVPLGSKTFLPQPFDSVDMKRFWFKHASAMHAPLLSIRLSDDFGEKLLADSTSFSTNSDFLKSFYGLHVAVDSVAGSFGKMIYFNRESLETKLVLYYTNSDSSSYYNFVINNNCIHFNEYRIDHSTADADLREQLTATGTPSELEKLGNQRLYLQPLNGVRIKVNFTGIEKLREMKNIVINEAKLYLNNAEDYNKDLPPVQQLSIYTVNANGKIITTPDFNLGMTYMGGKFNSEKNRYEMRITRYLQKRILNPDMDNDNLYISIQGTSFYANRVVLYGNNPNDGSDKKATIRILYSEY